MSKDLAIKEQEAIDGLQITYYFTVMFTAIGIALVFYILYQKVERINLFIILLSMSAGGLPVGIFGAFLDYKVSKYKLKIRGLEQ